MVALGNKTCPHTRLADILVVLFSFSSAYFFPQLPWKGTTGQGTLRITSSDEPKLHTLITEDQCQNRLCLHTKFFFYSHRNCGASQSVGGVVIGKLVPGGVCMISTVIEKC